MWPVWATAPNSLGGLQSCKPGRTLFWALSWLLATFLWGSPEGAHTLFAFTGLAWHKESINISSQATSTLVLLPAAGSSMLTDDIPTAPAPSRDAVVNAIQQLNAAPQLELFGADIDVMADTDEEDDDKEEKKDKKNHGEVDATALATVSHCRCWLVSLLACQPPISLRGNKNAARLAWGA